MADRYDKLLTDYFNGTLDKHVASYEVSGWFLEAHRAEYDDMKRYERLLMMWCMIRLRLSIRVYLKLSMEIE